MAARRTSEQIEALKEKLLGNTFDAHEVAVKLVHELECVRGEAAALEQKNADLRGALGGAASKHLQYGELRVLACLCERGLWPVGIAELSRLLDMPDSTVAGHLGKLVEAGFARRFEEQYVVGKIISNAGVICLMQEIQITRHLNHDEWKTLDEHWTALAKALVFSAEQ